ncbi:hypothetical protein HHI36_011563 [Cryptolaemus montrouzieri]|uniref:PiggyBac transposable element-derived protein domain-containing protein n=1 Tax=Cryptolaemus montrouzieri TaxID=559131 RepID=A0ABD2MM12_9CUCU
MTQTKKLKLQKFWSQDSLIQTPVSSQIIARDRYIHILRVLHFNNNDLSVINDPLQVPLLDHFANVFKTAFTLSKISVLTKIFCCIKGVFISSSTSPPNAIGLEYSFISYVIVTPASS